MIMINISLFFKILISISVYLILGFYIIHLFSDKLKIVNDKYEQLKEENNIYFKYYCKCIFFWFINVFVFIIIFPIYGIYLLIKHLKSPIKIKKDLAEKDIINE